MGPGLSVRWGGVRSFAGVPPGTATSSLRLAVYSPTGGGGTLDKNLQNVWPCMVVPPFKLARVSRN